MTNEKIGQVVKVERVQTGRLGDCLGQVEFGHGGRHVDHLHVLRDRVAGSIEKAIKEPLLGNVLHRSENGGILRGEDDIHVFGKFFRESERVPARPGIRKRARLLLRQAKRRIKLAAEVLFSSFVASVCDQNVVGVLCPGMERQILIRILSVTYHEAA